jgi:hypothetical protein
MLEKKENAREAFASWQTMKKTEKCDYICRVMAENHIKANPKDWKDKKDSENYYLLFLQDQNAKPTDFLALYEKWKNEFR